MVTAELVTGFDAGTRDRTVTGIANKLVALLDSGFLRLGEQSVRRLADFYHEGFGHGDRMAGWLMRAERHGQNYSHKRYRRVSARHKACRILFKLAASRVMASHWEQIR